MDKLDLKPLHHSLGGPAGRSGMSLGIPECGGYVFKQDCGPYLLCVFVVDVKTDTPPELRPKINKGSYLLCHLGDTATEADKELSNLTTEDVRSMAEAMLGPWARWT